MASSLAGLVAAPVATILIFLALVGMGPGVAADATTSFFDPQQASTPLRTTTTLTNVADFCNPTTTSGSTSTSTDAALVFSTTLHRCIVNPCRVLDGEYFDPVTEMCLCVGSMTATAAQSSGEDVSFGDSAVRSSASSTTTSSVTSTAGSPIPLFYASVSQQTSVNTLEGELSSSTDSATGGSGPSIATAAATVDGATGRAVCRPCSARGQQMMPSRSGATPGASCIGCSGSIYSTQRALVADLASLDETSLLPNIQQQLDAVAAGDTALLSTLQSGEQTIRTTRAALVSRLAASVNGYPALTALLWRGADQPVGFSSGTATAGTAGSTSGLFVSADGTSAWSDSSAIWSALLRGVTTSILQNATEAASLQANFAATRAELAGAAWTLDLAAPVYAKDITMATTSVWSASLQRCQCPAGFILSDVGGTGAAGGLSARGALFPVAAAVLLQLQTERTPSATATAGWALGSTSLATVLGGDIYSNATTVNTPSIPARGLGAFVCIPCASSAALDTALAARNASHVAQAPQENVALRAASAAYVAAWRQTLQTNRVDGAFACRACGPVAATFPLAAAAADGSNTSAISALAGGGTTGGVGATCTSFASGGGCASGEYLMRYPMTVPSDSAHLPNGTSAVTTESFYCIPAARVSQLLTGVTTSLSAIDASVQAPNLGNTGAPASSKSPSAVMDLLLLRSFFGCAQGGNATACQALANLCTLVLYAPKHAACTLYQRALTLSELQQTNAQTGAYTSVCEGGTAGNAACETPSRLPWLNYLRSSSEIIADAEVSSKVALRAKSGSIDRLRFVVFEYAIDGTLIDRRVVTSDLALCDVPAATARDFFLIGTTSRVTCSLNLRHWLQVHKPGSGPRRAVPATTFFELFMEDTTSDSSSTGDATLSSTRLIPIPVVIDSTTTSEIRPSSVNDGKIARSASTVPLTPAENAWRRRFFLVDNVLFRSSSSASSSASSGSSSGSTGASGSVGEILRTMQPAYVTFARQVTIVITKVPDSHTPRILLPVVVLQYESRATSVFSTSAVGANAFSDVSGELRFLRTNSTLSDTIDTSDSGGGGTATSTTRILYTRANNNPKGQMEPAITAICIVVFFTASFRTFGYMRRQQSMMMNFPILARWFVYLCNHAANLLALYVFCCCGIFYILFKHQAAVEYLLPQGKIPPVWVPLYVAFGAKAFAIIYHIIEQTNVDFFIIDWERSKGQLLRGGKDPSVSMWRSTFIANELNELQTRRGMPIQLIILAVLFFLEGLNYVNLGLALPHAEYDPKVVGCGVASPSGFSIEYDPILRLAVAAFFWVVIALVLYVLEYEIYYRFITPHPLQAFVDLCSVSNISVLILLEPNWGFYIHGESIHAFADASLEEFQQNLQREAQGNLPMRGLGGLESCQTFEVFVSPYLRHFLYVCYFELEHENVRALRGEAGNFPVHYGHHRRVFDFLTGRGGRTRVLTQETLAIKKRMNYALQSSVHAAEKNILQRFGLHAALDFPPNVMYMNGVNPWSNLGFGGANFQNQPPNPMQNMMQQQQQAEQQGLVQRQPGGSSVNTSQPPPQEQQQQQQNQQQQQMFPNRPPSAFAGGDMFFVDEPTHYGLAFISGLELDLFVFYVLLYCLVDSQVTNTFIAMLCVYLVDVVLYFYRRKEGQANLGSKTLFDDRFFL